MMSFHVVLVEPEIPQNTGNIGRICAVAGMKLHLVHPLGFKMHDSRLKLAGRDFWEELEVEQHASLQALQAKYATGRFFFTTSRTDKKYTDFHYTAGDFFVFGRESKGLSPAILASHPDTSIRIPMLPQGMRCHNITNAVAIIVYEALRQLDFPHLS
jgi:tRNA (cytidine/uridine-2'-O-)-methyltransferase